MKFKWYGIVLSCALTALFFSGAAVYKFCSAGGAEKSTILEIRDAASGRIYGSWPLEGSGEFSIEFIHSVNQSPVREKFRVEGKTILPVEVRFFSFGAGMRSDSEPGLSMSRDGDALVISGYNTPYAELNYIVGTVSDHLLIINDQTIRLRELCGRNAHISVRIK